METDKIIPASEFYSIPEHTPCWVKNVFGWRQAYRFAGTWQIDGHPCLEPQQFTAAIKIRMPEIVAKENHLI